jgi:hypothetical protein
LRNIYARGVTAMTTTDEPTRPAPRRTPEEAQEWASKVWRRFWIGLAAFAAVIVVWGVLGSSHEREIDPANDPAHQRYVACERAAEDNGLDPYSEDGQVAMGRCMDLLEP